MTDVNKVHGPTGPTGDPGKKEKSTADADKFKDEMRKRVEEVSKVDPDEQKKRKQREEENEEDFTQPPADAASSAQVTPFSMEKGGQKPRLEDLQKEGTGVSPLKSAQPSPTSSSQGRGLDSPAGPIGEETSQTPMSPSKNENQEPVRSNLSQPSPSTETTQEPSSRAPSSKEPQRTSPLEKESQKRADIPSSLPYESTHSQKNLEESEPFKEQEALFFESLKGKPSQEEERKKISEADQEAQAASPLPGLASQEKKHFEKESPLLIEAPTSPIPIENQSLAPLPPAPETLPPYAHLHPQVQELFERMVGVMTVMSHSGMNEIVITLNAPQFSSSVFFGTQIIIQEFSTAPHAFNIQLNGTPQAVTLIQNNADDLMAAFQAGNYGFRVNRFETGYLTSRSQVRRIEKTEGEKQDQTGEGH